MTAPIRVGVVGCGEIAQIMHLRFLEELPEFEIIALCDVSETVLATLGNRYRVSHLFTDYSRLVELQDLDAVAVCTPDHVGPVEAALAAGKHVFSEKPLAFDPTDARRIVEIGNRSSLVAMVGYMRLFDPAYEYAQSLLGSLGVPRLIEAHDFMARYDKHAPLFPLVAAQRSEGDKEASANLVYEGTRAVLQRSVGEDACAQDLYWNMLMGASHDVSLLRGAFGPPTQILFAESDAPNRLIACLEYGRKLRALLTVDTLASYEWWDQHLTVYGAEGTLALTFANPYIPYVPTTITQRSAAAECSIDTEVVVSNEPPFRREWRHFADCIRTGAPPRSSLEGAAEDVEVIAELARAAVRRGTFSGEESRLKDRDSYG